MWNIYNIGADVCFGVGLIMKLIEIILIEYVVHIDLSSLLPLIVCFFLTVAHLQYINPLY